MFHKTPQPVGTVGWMDLTVAEAEELKSFYAEVVGWLPDGVDMGGYADYTMNAPDSGEPVAGICHARGDNAGLPAQWLMYIVVADLERSLKSCEKLGGAVIASPRSLGEQGRYAVIRDPAGAVAALCQPA